ncbi:hypothetical protein [Streptomyces sp. NRRL S-1824]|nr:hypothetical protein [Streptomyces sp. NRRL S-1824]
MSRAPLRLARHPTVVSSAWASPTDATTSRSRSSSPDAGMTD